MTTNIFENWAARWEQTISAVQKVVKTESWRLQINPPVTLSEIKTVEDSLGFKLPESFKEVLCNFSANVDFYWFLREFSFPPPLDFISHGICSWAVDDLVSLEEDRLQWLSLSTGDDSPYEIIKDKMCFLTVGNGDKLAIDLKKNSDGQVVYLACHFDDEQGHGYLLGENFIDFIDRWTQIGCIGPEIWETIEFINGPTGYINPAGEKAIEWRKLLGI